MSDKLVQKFSNKNTMKIKLSANIPKIFWGKNVSSR